MDTQGIYPVPPDERPHTRIWDNFTMWFSVSTTIAYILVGLLGWQLFRLAFWQAFLCIVFANAIAAVPGAFFTTLGFRTGLRQMVIVRYSFGYHGGKVISAVNCVNSIGWAVINIIQSAQLFAAIGGAEQARLPLWAGVLILSVTTWVLCVVGYRLIHGVQRWLWIPMWTAFALLFGLGLANNDTAPVLSHPAAESAAVMSYVALVYASQPLWPLACADFTVEQPASFSPYAVGMLSYVGGVIPTILTETLGYVLAAAWTPQHPDASADIGALASSVFAPLGWFGDVLLVLFAFNVVGHTAPSEYNMALTMQTIVPWRIWVLSTLGMVVVTVMGALGAEHLVGVMQTFLPVLTYCIVPYTAILASEHFLFRPCGGRYEVDHWNSPSRLPVGIAALLAEVVGFAGGMLGTQMPWFTGPVARHTGDIGVPLALAFSFCTYPPLRYWEQQVWGR